MAEPKYVVVCNQKQCPPSKTPVGKGQAKSFGRTHENSAHSGAKTTGVRKAR